MSHNTILYKHGKRTHNFSEVLVFYILGAFLIKQSFQSSLLDMSWYEMVNSALRPSLAIYFLGAVDGSSLNFYGTN